MLIRDYAEHLEAMVRERTGKLEAAEQELRRDYDLQTVLNTLLRLALEDISLQEILDKSLRVVLSVSWLSFRPKGCIFLIDRETCKPFPAVSHNLEEPEVLACSRETQNICDGPDDGPEMSGRPAIFPMNPGSTGLCIPLMQRNVLLGALNLVKKNESINQREKTFIDSISNTLAGIIRHMQVEEEILHGAYHDSLTGLANKPKLLGRINDVLAENGGRDFALFMLDLDGFKLINDSMGHETGDRLLVEIAERMKGLMSDSCLLARLGGDEFAALGSGIDSDASAAKNARRLMNTLAEPFHIDRNEIYITTSIGAVHCRGYEKAEDIVRDADTALHEAKIEGADNWKLFDSAMRHKATHYVQTANELRRAIKNQELLLHLQPLIEIESGAIRGAEALVRWNHPGRGMIPPDRFIPVAEESRLIIGLGSWVLREACRMYSELVSAHGLEPSFMMSVNISGVQFGNPNLVDEIGSVLREFRVPPECLKLEITETAVMQKAQTAMGILDGLKELGVRISIDDFGTGYSSLAYLHKFPIDMLKIDRTFVNSMKDGGENLEIVRTIVTLAHALKLMVIGEGIEDREQLAVLKNLKCDYGQGYLFSRPLPFDDFVRHIEITGGRRPEFAPAEEDDARLR
jgi:diguanylate cyclase (GGDEF)-like protein